MLLPAGMAITALPDAIQERTTIMAGCMTSGRCPVVRCEMRAMATMGREKTTVPPVKDEITQPILHLQILGLEADRTAGLEKQARLRTR